MITEDDFRHMCQQHDLTYAYSDDRRSYKAGKDSYAKILSAAKELPRAVAVQIWNESVDKALGEGHRAQFYWSE